MKKFEFETHVNDDETVNIPTEIAAQIERNSAVHVVMLIPDHTDDQQWTDFTAEQFLQGYADTDAIYDDVSTG